jgi:hypothetical protein
MSLLIINFEGVIGEVMKIPFFDPNGKFGLWIKRGVLDGIEKLLKKFRVVLMISKPYEEYSHVL